MPLDRHAEFLAVDEIQLGADRERGHVFTDRLLHARGLIETMVPGRGPCGRWCGELMPQATVRAPPAHVAAALCRARPS